MDFISNWIASWKIPIGLWGRDFFDFLTTHFYWFFDRLSDGLRAVLEGLVDLLAVVSADPDGARDHACWPGI